ncbi:MAG: phosphotransferase family protein [Thermonemataceae bacterium]
MKVDQAQPTRKGEELAVERLHPYLEVHLGIKGPLTVKQFPSGFSNLTYLLSLGDKELVLRRPPFGAEEINKGHDMEREYKVLSQLHPVYAKAPKPLLYCDATDIIGAPFYVMERVAGIILRAGRPIDLPESTVQQLCYNFIDSLAALHSIDIEATGLVEMGKPAGYLERQVTGWSKRYKKAQTDEIAAMNQLIDWLAANLPDSPPASMIHNDYKFDNLVLDEQDPTYIKAVLDWEMATVGDPLSDLGLALAYYPEVHDPASMLQFSLPVTKGMLTRKALVERYLEKRDVSLTPSQLIFYYAFGLFKIGVIVQQIYYRYKKGYTQDERFAALIYLLKAAAAMATQAIEKEKI